MQLRISDPETFVDRIERPRPSSSKSSGRPAYDEIRRAEDRALSGWNSEGFAKGGIGVCLGLLFFYVVIVGPVRERPATHAPHPRAHDAATPSLHHTAADPTHICTPQPKSPRRSRNAVFVRALVHPVTFSYCCFRLHGDDCPMPRAVASLLRRRKAGSLDHLGELHAGILIEIWLGALEGGVGKRVFGMRRKAGVEGSMSIMAKKPPGRSTRAAS